VVTDVGICCSWHSAGRRLTESVVWSPVVTRLPAAHRWQSTAGWWYPQRHVVSAAWTTTCSLHLPVQNCTFKQFSHQLLFIIIYTGWSKKQPPPFLLLQQPLAHFFILTGLTLAIPSHSFFTDQVKTVKNHGTTYVDLGSAVTDNHMRCLNWKMHQNFVVTYCFADAFSSMHLQGVHTGLGNIMSCFS